MPEAVSEGMKNTIIDEKWYRTFVLFSPLSSAKITHNPV